MRSRTLGSVLVALLLAGGAAVSAQETLGRVHFPIGCAPAVQQPFDRAVALLHSFEYRDAVRAFTGVAEQDPGCAMAYWGVAMSHWYPLWAPPSTAALAAGRAAVEKAKALGGTNDRERDYIAAIEAFYRDADRLDHRTRALAYESAMEALARRYSSDREATIFYALALNATVLPTDKGYEKQRKAGEMLERVFAEQPDHPGIAHYIIHSYDYPPLGGRALDAARRYARIAPSAPHALHMPSHIFVRLGLWQETIDTNRDSVTAARQHGDGQGRFHALDYMAYAYLQRAQDATAARLVDDVSRAGVSEREETFATAYAAAAIPARYALERRQWREAASLAPAPSRYTYAEALTHFARALGAARGGDLPGARAAAERLGSLRDGLTQAKQTYWAEQVEIQRLAAVAWVARAEGKNDEARRLMRAAADLEDSTEKHPVTPGPIVPARELLGELLLEQGEPAQALREFESALRASPQRFGALAGAAKAAELAGDRTAARAFYEKLTALASAADTERPALREAKAFLGSN